jgi:hypothetical protein
MQDELFGMDEVDDFRTAKERYGIWPITVWDCNMSDPMTRRLKALVGDDGNARESGDGYTIFANRRRHAGTSDHLSGGKIGIFNPAVAAWILNCYAPIGGGFCFDPFAGGGTRAIMAAKHDLLYCGYEIRQQEVDAVVSRCVAAGVGDDVTIVHGDSRHCDKVGDGSQDFLFTCPPYWTLEQYNGGPGDLSMLSDYQEFLNAIGDVIAETFRVLRVGSISCWVVGMTRDEGRLIPLHHDIARLHTEAGFVFHEEVVLSLTNNGAVQRVGMFDRGNRFLVRTHEYLLVFKKPDEAA